MTQPDQAALDAVENFSSWIPSPDDISEALRVARRYSPSAFSIHNIRTLIVCAEHAYESTEAFTAGWVAAVRTAAEREWERGRQAGRAEAEAKYAKLVEAADAILIGGNHLASALVSLKCFPSEQQNYEQVFEDFGQPCADMYEAWKRMMAYRNVRDGIK